MLPTVTSTPTLGSNMAMNSPAGNSSGLATRTFSKSTLRALRGQPPLVARGELATVLDLMVGQARIDDLRDPAEGPS